METSPTSRTSPLARDDESKIAPVTHTLSGTHKGGVLRGELMITARFLTMAPGCG